MKLLKQYHDLLDAEDMAEKLERKGIVTHISSKQSQSLSPHRTGAIKVGVWVILEHQYHDALAYINNSSHKITTGISPQEIADLKQQSSVSSYNLLNKFLKYAFAGITITLAILYIIVSK